MENKVSLYCLVKIQSALWIKTLLYHFGILPTVLFSQYKRLHETKHPLPKDDPRTNTERKGGQFSLSMDIYLSG